MITLRLLSKASQISKPYHRKLGKSDNLLPDKAFAKKPQPHTTVICPQKKPCHVFSDLMTFIQMRIKESASLQQLQGNANSLYETRNESKSIILL